MNIPEPTVWPQPGQFPAAAGPIADWMNVPILEARIALNVKRLTLGLAKITDDYGFEGEYLPIYPRDGWRRLQGVPPYQIIGPFGIGGFGLHEFQGHPEIRERVYAMQRLWKNSLGPSSPLPPAPAPAEGETPVPIVTYPGAPPLVGDPSTALPPGTPDPNSPPAGPVIVPVIDDGAVDFGGGISLRLTVNDTRLPTVGVGKVVRLSPATVAFHYGDPANLEVFAKVIDGRPVNGKWWVFSCGMTDVGVTLTAIRGSETKSYANPQGTGYAPQLDTSAFAD